MSFWQRKNFFFFKWWNSWEQSRFLVCLQPFSSKVKGYHSALAYYTHPGSLYAPGAQTPSHNPSRSIPSYNSKHEPFWNRTYLINMFSGSLIDLVKVYIPETLIVLFLNHLYCRFWEKCKQGKCYLISL